LKNRIARKKEGIIRVREAAGGAPFPIRDVGARVNYREPRVALDKSEGVVKGKLLPSVFLAPLVSPEKVEDQGSGNLTLNHLRW
jgi:hypothetical protein